MTERERLTETARGVVRVGEGRGFVVNYLNYLGLVDRIVITAAHCLPFFPPCHPHAYLEERTYKSLLGQLGDAPTVWAECLFADPITDIAVLGSPDNQDLYEQADQYQNFVQNVLALSVADAPAQGLVTFGGRQILDVTRPAKGPVYLLSLDGRWLQASVERRSNVLAVEPPKLVVSGMSGSPIVSVSGAAIAVVSTEQLCPVIADCLPVWLARRVQP